MKPPCAVAGQGCNVAKPVDEHVKANGMAMLLGGASLGEVSRALNVHKGTVQRWNDHLRRSGQFEPKEDRMHTVDTAIQVQTQAAYATRMHTDAYPKRKTADLISDLIEANVRAQIAILRNAEEPAWLERQGAEGLGVFLGIAGDKLGRMLEAMQKAQALSKGMAKPVQQELPLDTDGSQDS